MSLSDVRLNGERSLAPVSGRHAEVEAFFTVGASRFGFTFFGDGSDVGRLCYDPATGEIVADFTALDRWSNDRGVYDGVYRMRLPERPAVGSELKINLFIDGSILDIFVNDKWAQSIRVFPQGDHADAISVYADGETTARSIKAWTLKSDGAGIDGIFDDETDRGETDGPVDVYHISGRMVRGGVDRADAVAGLDSGIYIIDGKKVVVK